MFVRMKVGAYAGEVRELTFVAAKSLLDAGHAEIATFGPEDPVIERRAPLPLPKPVARAVAKAKKAR